MDEIPVAAPPCHTFFTTVSRAGRAGRPPV